MKRFLSLMLALVCLLCFATPAAAMEADAEDYTVAGKLLKQLWAGSGFSGTLSIELAAKEGAQAASTLKPIVLDVNYIYVRPTAAETAEHRADVTLMDGEAATSAAHAQVKDGALAVQADVLSPDWYSFGPAGQAADGESVTGGAKEALLKQTGMPGLAAAGLELLWKFKNVEGLEDALATYLTRVDLWIENYRQDTVLGKLADGTTTMEVHYTVGPAAIKAQAKQLILDLLSDQTVLGVLQQALGEELSGKLLNPNLQSYYFAAVDELPLTDSLTISRTVSLKGDTLALHLSLPLYDTQTGNVTLRYDRTSGEGDLPDENAIGLESDTRAIALTYQEYSSMTGVRVIQGSFESEPRGADAYSVEGEQTQAQKKLALSFSLKQQESESKDGEGRDVYDYEAELTLKPEATGEDAADFPATEAVLSAQFASKELKAAATDMNAKLTLGGEGWNQTLTLTLEGRTRKKWDPETLPEDRIYVSQMTQEDIAALLPGAALRGMALMAEYLSLPQDAQQPEATTSAPEKGGEAEPAAAPAPTAEPTGKATAAPSAAPTEEPESEPSPTPTEEPEAEPTAAPTEEPEAEPSPTPTEEPEIAPSATPNG
ncbi:MAG: PT domain-containing protein [Clostridiales bacterium]|nr:PT domain-containing protein [Clostridiales bacterium]